MDRTEEFLAEVLPAYIAAETAIHNGDASPRQALWSRTDPVTLFGAAVVGKGWEELAATFEWLAATMTECTSYENELIAAEVSGDLAYHVALEHSSCLINGEPRTYVLRVTTVFRREDGTWKIVHRHGDPLPAVTMHEVGQESVGAAVS